MTAAKILGNKLVPLMVVRNDIAYPLTDLMLVPHQMTANYPAKPHMINLN